jgi:hypothetical protein
MPYPERSDFLESISEISAQFSEAVSWTFRFLQRAFLKSVSSFLSRPYPERSDFFRDHSIFL